MTRLIFNTVTRLENICPDYEGCGAALARGHTLLCTILGLGLGRGETWQLSGTRHRGSGGRVTPGNIPIPTFQHISILLGPCTNLTGDSVVASD